jgi:hypothetical protein
VSKTIRSEAQPYGMEWTISPSGQMIDRLLPHDHVKHTSMVMEIPSYGWAKLRD